MHPATTAAMMRHFENPPLVLALTAKGPVTEVRAADVGGVQVRMVAEHAHKLVVKPNIARAVAHGR